MVERVARRSGRGDGGRGRELISPRLVDHLPRSRGETFHVFGTAAKEPFGWLAERTGWKGEWEIFRYEPRGDGQVEVVFPQSGQRARLTYRAWRCNEKDFDYCLELSGARGPTKYYSRRGWERGKLDVQALESLGGP